MRPILFLVTAAASLALGAVVDPAMEPRAPAPQDGNCPVRLETLSTANRPFC
jgi:hypothetical protein